nr:MAG TPA: hypothetical protein [Caudoviricetes sp.]
MAFIMRIILSPGMAFLSYLNQILVFTNYNYFENTNYCN